LEQVVSAHVRAVILEPIARHTIAHVPIILALMEPHVLLMAVILTHVIVNLDTLEPTVRILTPVRMLSARTEEHQLKMETPVLASVHHAFQVLSAKHVIINFA